MFEVNALNGNSLAPICGNAKLHQDNRLHLPLEFVAPIEHSETPSSGKDCVTKHTRT